MTSPLYYAAKNGCTSACGLLLDMGANICYEFELSPLTIAIECGHTDTVALLIDYNVNIDIRHLRPYSLLILAVKNRRLDIIKLILERGIDTHLINTAYLYATHLNDTDIMEWLRSNYNVRSIEHRELELLKDLKHGRDNIAKEGYVEATHVYLNTRWVRLDQILIMIAVEKTWNEDMFKFLIEYGADVDKFDSWLLGWELMEICKFRRPSSILAYLISHCYSTSDQSEKEEYTYKIKFLLSMGANIHRGYNGITPLHLAVDNGCIWVAQILLDHGADINYRTIEDETPLMWAVKGSNMYRFLIEHGANIS